MTEVSRQSKSVCLYKERNENMEEKNKEISLPEIETEATMPEKFTVPVKYNKETRNLSIEEASTLSQKGLKFVSLENELSRLKALASKRDMNLGDYLTALENEDASKRKDELLKECGGNEKIADMIISLSEKEKPEIRGLEELSKYFPGETSEDIPDEVFENAKLKNSNIVDEYLRFKAMQDILQKKAEEKLTANGLADAGSQKTPDASFENPESSEFIRGVWGN